MNNERTVSSLDVFSADFANLPTEDPDARMRWLAHLRADQQSRYRSGRQIPVEDYLKYFATQLDDEIAIDRKTLVYVRTWHVG